MYTKKDIKKAVRLAKEQPDASVTDILKQLVPDVPVEQINSVIDHWNSKDPLPNVRKRTELVRKIVARAIGNFGLDSCLQSIDNYATVLKDSDYYFDTIWDIKKFFTQNNAAPDFMDDGVKWLNYSKSSTKSANKQTEWQDASKGLKNEIEGRILSLVNTFKEKHRHSIPINIQVYTEEDVQKERKRTLQAALYDIKPCIIAYACHEKGVWIKDPLQLRDGRQIKTKFESVIVLNKAGYVLEEKPFKKQLEKWKII